MTDCSREGRILAGTRGALHDASAPAVLARNATAAYGHRVALRDISFELPARKHVAVIGPNGAGKSTLLQVIAGLLPLVEGNILIHGHAPREHLCTAYVPQRSTIDWRFPVTVEDVVRMGRTGRLGPLRRSREDDRRLTREAVARVGLTPLSRRQIGELSGGEQQRMFIARAIAQEAEIVLLDEPFSGLDVAATADVLSLLDGLKETTLVVALHDLAVAGTHFERVLLLRERLIGYGTPEDVFRPEILQQAYGDFVRMVRTSEGTLVVHDECTEEVP